MLRLSGLRFLNLSSGSPVKHSKNKQFLRFFFKNFVNKNFKEIVQSLTKWAADDFKRFYAETLMNFNENFFECRVFREATFGLECKKLQGLFNKLCKTSQLYREVNQKF